MKRKPLSLDEHQEIAKHIYAIKQHLHCIFKIAANRVPSKISDQLLSFVGLDRKLQKLRSDLEDLMFDEHRPMGHRGTSYYYVHVDAQRDTSITLRGHSNNDDKELWKNSGSGATQR